MEIRLKEDRRKRGVLSNAWWSQMRFPLAKLSHIIFNPRKHPQKYASQRHRDLRNATYFVNNYVGPALMELK